MKLRHFSVENYRSISAAHQLNCDGPITVLIGPNNEGKSNILRALVTALKAITRFGRQRVIFTNRHLQRVRSGEPFHHPNRRIFRDDFDWERDFPIQAQTEEQEGVSSFVLAFDPTAKQRRAFENRLKLNLAGDLVIELRPAKSDCELRVRDSASPLNITNDAAPRVCEFMADYIRCQYIPSIRNAESAQKIVEAIVERELAALENKRQYRAALAAIERVQRPALQAISANVTTTMKEFLPAVKRVRIEISDADRTEALRRACSIIVDDGTRTNLTEKGDGIQSLAALSLMRYSALVGAKGRRIVLAVEEPETHLHSRAIHQLKAVLQEIASHHQVIITTHNSVFVNRDQVATNIVVAQNKASPAKSFEQIRDTLGIRPSENLRHAEVVLVVEGSDDRIALESLLSANSAKLRAAIKNGTLAIDPIFGCGNLTYKLSLLKNAMCETFVFLDDDTAGRTAAESAQKTGILPMKRLKFTVCRGKDDAEFEDLFSPTIYEPVIKKDFGVTLIKPLTGKQKWSDRVKGFFKAQGHQWDAALEAAVKLKVANAVAAAPKSALHPPNRSPFDALVKSLETMLDELAAGKPK